MRISVVVFVLGSIGLVLSVTAPCPLLGAKPILLAVGLLFVVVAPILAAAPSWVGDTPLFTLLALSPWILAALVVSNGLFDRASENLYETIVIGQSLYGNYDAVTVQSWRPGRSTEGLFVRTEWSFRAGKPAVVGVRPGALGIPWVSSISQGTEDLHFPMVSELRPPVPNVERPPK